MKYFINFFCLTLSLFCFSQVPKDSIKNNDLKLAALPYYSFGKGLGITSPDSIFQLNIRFRMQNRVTYFSEEEKENRYEAQIRRLRLRFDGKCRVRAPFHAKTEAEFDIVIEPKMSFGTGHHETTHMMIQHLLYLELKNKKVLDMGCGTGILAIFAEMRGAKPTDAIDIDTWCYENSLENVARNNCHHITVLEGDSSLLVNKKYDVIIANINRNILLSDMKIYTDCLHEDGILLLSGFYKEDIPIIDEEVAKHGLTLNKTIDRNNWVALKYLK